MSVSGLFFLPTNHLGDDLTSAPSPVVLGIVAERHIQGLEPVEPAVAWEQAEVEAGLGEARAEAAKPETAGGAGVTGLKMLPLGLHTELCVQHRAIRPKIMLQIG